MSTDIFWSIYKDEPPKADVRSSNELSRIRFCCDYDTVIVQVRPEQLERAKAAAEAFNAIFAKTEIVTPVTDEAA